MTVLKEKGSMEPVIFHSLSENGGNYHYIPILAIFFKGRRNFCMLMPIRTYLRHLRSKTEGHQSVCQVHGLSARCAWDRKQASWICQWLYEKNFKIYHQIMPELKLLGMLQGNPATFSCPWPCWGFCSYCCLTSTWKPHLERVQQQRQTKGHAIFTCKRPLIKSRCQENRDAVVSQLHVSADGKDKLRATTSRHETLQVWIKYKASVLTGEAFEMLGSSLAT